MAYTTINKSSSFMNPKLYTGNATNNATVTGVGFESDFTWLKARSGSQATQPNWVFDSIRGATKPLVTNSATAEVTETGSLKSWQSDGFTLGLNNEINGSSTEYVSWNWLAGTAVSGQTTGSGTYKTYTGSVNTTSGFSIIKYTGNGSSGHTIPHNLGAIPQWVVIKELPNASDWMGYHQILGNTKTIKLNEPDAPVTGSSYWYDTTPTSSVVTLGSSGEINQNDTNYVMYAFSGKQGYSNFGSYTGNGNADGTFVYTGFKPAFVMFKSTASGTNWFMLDNKRQGFNPANETLSPNTSSAASSTGLSVNTLDFLSNGFKMRTNNAEFNATGSTYIYMAFGQSLVGTNNIPNNAR